MTLLSVLSAPYPPTQEPTVTHWNPCPPPDSGVPVVLRWPDGTMEVGVVTDDGDYHAPDGQDLGPVDEPTTWCAIPPHDWPPPDCGRSRRGRRPKPAEPMAIAYAGEVNGLRATVPLAVGAYWPHAHAPSVTDRCLRVVAVDGALVRLCGQPVAHAGPCEAPPVLTRVVGP